MGLFLTLLSVNILRTQGTETETETETGFQRARSGLVAKICSNPLKTSGRSLQLQASKR
jgi:hypothetical protein